MSKLVIKSLLLLAITSVMTFVVGCSKKMTDYEGYTIQGTSPNGKQVIFTTQEGLYGVAEANGGKVVVNPEYGYIELYGDKFIFAFMSEEQYDRISMNMLKKAGYNPDLSPEENYSRLQRLEKHDFIELGRTGHQYRRLFNSNGKMLKDYALRPFVKWNPVMGDTIIWKTEGNNNPKRDAYQIVTVSGKETDIDDSNYGTDWFCYKQDGTIFAKSLGHEPISFSGANVIRIQKIKDLYFSLNKKGKKGKSYFKIYTPKGKELDFGNWTPYCYTSKLEPGIFVMLYEGNPYEGNSDRETYVGLRKQKIVLITDDGMVTEQFPKGYYYKQSSYSNAVDLYLPGGHQYGHVFFEHDLL